MTPLDFAARRGSTDAVAFLLANGTDVDAVDQGGYTPLFYATGKSLPKDTTELLLAHGAKVDAQESRLTDLNR